MELPELPAAGSAPKGLLRGLDLRYSLAAVGVDHASKELHANDGKAIVEDQQG